MKNLVEGMMGILAGIAAWKLGCIECFFLTIFILFVLKVGYASNK